LSALVQACSKCPKLRAEAAKHRQFATDADAAQSVYADAPTPPRGYRAATDSELAEMRLTREYIDEPLDPQTGRPTEFRAAVFIEERTGDPLVAFRGTQSIDDWRANFSQGLGMDSFHYSRAQSVADRVASSPRGANVRFTGHSLGGGLAAAAARKTGRPATTFNAAGLHADTVRNPVDAPIDAVHVRGELLTTAQYLPGLPDARSTARWPLDPPPSIGSAIITGIAAGLSGWAGAAAAAYRSYRLHGMESVQAALARRRQGIERELVRNGC
jgi:hypothetical protein